MDQRWFPFPMALVAVATGMVGQAIMCFGNAEGPLSLFVVGLFAWGCTPYLASLAIARWGHPSYGFFAAAACMGGDLLTYLSVFVNPESSTAAIGLLFAPIANLFFFLPLGAVIGHLNKRLAERAPAR